jgi:hypothetical protein
VVAEFVHADIWTDRQTHRQTDTQTTWLADRQTWRS